MDYTAVGDTTNVAARLQQIADPGRIVISAPTHRLVDGYFYTRSLGELPLKGKAEPVPAWELIAGREARTRLEVEAERGLTPFVGRVRELELLRDAFERARAGRGQIVFVAGEPGIGKSRLLLEFRRRLAGDATWVEGHCMSFGRSIAFHPLIDLLKRSFRIEEGGWRVGHHQEDRAVGPRPRRGPPADPPAPQVSALGRSGRSRHRAMDPPQRRGEIFERRAPADDAGGARSTPRSASSRISTGWTRPPRILLSVADSVAASRVLLVLTYRPGYASRSGSGPITPGWRSTRSPARTASRWPRAVLAADRCPPTSRRSSSSKAEGNPFFIEEVVKSLQEVGRSAGRRPVRPGPAASTSLVPDTIQDVIMARIDRLEEAPKKTLQLASVIGREFTRRLLDRIADMRGAHRGVPPGAQGHRADLREAPLSRAGLHVQARADPRRGLQLAACPAPEGTAPAIGLAIEELYADRLAEHYEVIAYHFTRAEDWDKALAQLLAAGKQAIRAHALRDALVLYESGTGGGRPARCAGASSASGWRSAAPARIFSTRWATTRRRSARRTIS